MDTTNMLPEMNASGTDVATQNSEPSTLAEALGAEPAQQVPAPEPEAQQPRKEPGYLATKRAEWEAAHQQEMNALNEQIATLRDYMVNQEADKLVASGKVTDREIALAYVRAQNGVPAVGNSPAKPAPQRDERGRFVSNNTPPADIQQKAQALLSQADKLSRFSGVDLMGLYNSDPNVQQKIISGEWDFVDVLDHANASQPSNAAPAPVRSHNGLGMGGMNFRSMTDDQFAKVNAMLDGGKSIDMRR